MSMLAVCLKSFAPYECTGGGERGFGERINKPVLERARELWICGLVVDDTCKLCFVCVDKVFSSVTQPEFRGSSLECLDFGEDFVTHSGLETAWLSKCGSVGFQIKKCTYHLILLNLMGISVDKVVVRQIRVEGGLFINCLTTNRSSPSNGYHSCFVFWKFRIQISARWPVVLWSSWVSSVAPGKWRGTSKQPATTSAFFPMCYSLIVVSFEAV